MVCKLRRKTTSSHLAITSAQAKGEAKGLFSSNPFSGAAEKVAGAAQEARSDARGAVSDVTGANPLDAAKNSVSSAVDKLTGTIREAGGEAKSKLPLGIAGLNDKVTGAAKEAGANVKDAVSNVTGANPIDGGKNLVNQAADKASGSAKEVSVGIGYARRWMTSSFFKRRPLIIAVMETCQGLVVFYC